MNFYFYTSFAYFAREVIQSEFQSLPIELYRSGVGAGSSEGPLPPPLKMGGGSRVISLSSRFN